MFNTQSEALVKQDPQELAMPERVIMMIMDAARDKSIDIDKLERLMAMQQQMVQDQRRLDFDQAMTRLQAKLPQITKYGAGKNAKFVKYEDMDTIVRPLLAEEGFSASFSEEATAEGKVRFALEVSRAGHSKFYYRTMTIDTAATNREGKGIRPAIQDDGSTTSYARRYLLKMALNIVEKGEDKDGDSGEGVNAGEVKVLKDLITQTNSDEAAFLKYAKVEKFEDIQVRNYKALLNLLETKKRNMVTPPTKPETKPPVVETKPGIVEPAGQPPLMPDPELCAKKWFIRIEQSPNVDMLKEIGLLLAKTDDPLTDDHRQTARALYAARMKQLKEKPLIQEPPKTTGEEPWI